MGTTMSSDEHDQTPYRRTLRAAIADAFDIYLSILRAVKKRVTVALGRDTPDWRALYACPACGYEVCTTRSLCLNMPACDLLTSGYSSMASANTAGPGFSVWMATCR